MCKLKDGTCYDGHMSYYGIAIEVLLGLVLDYDILSK